MKKLTNKEMQFHLSRLHQQMEQVCMMLDRVGTLLHNYISFKKDDTKFIKHMNKIDKEMREKNGRNNNEKPKPKKTK